MHYLTDSDTTSYPYGKGKVSALKTLTAGNFTGLYSVLGEFDASHAQLMEAGQIFFCALYGQPEGTTMSDARYFMYTRKSGKPLKLMALPPTEINLFLHILRAHLQTILAKSADQQAPLELDITKYGWDIKDGIPVPATSATPPAPLDFMNVVRCGCKAVGKACSTASCSCHHAKISCTLYCTCGCGDNCFNPHKIGEEEDHEVEEVGVEAELEGGEGFEKEEDIIYGFDDEWE